MLKEVNRPLDSINTKAIIKKARALGNEDKGLGDAQKELLHQSQDEYRKVLIPCLLLFSEEFQKQVALLNEEGLIKSIYNSYENANNVDWIDEGGDLVQAKTHKDSHIFIGYQPPRYKQGQLGVTAQILLPGTNNASIGPNLIQLRISDEEVHELPASCLDEPSQMKELVRVIEHMISTSLAFQLKQDYLRE